MQNLASIFNPVHFEARRFRNDAKFQCDFSISNCYFVSKLTRLKVDWVENPCQILHFLIAYVLPKFGVGRSLAVRPRRYKIAPRNGRKICSFINNSAAIVGFHWKLVRGRNVGRRSGGLRVKSNMAKAPKFRPNWNFNFVSQPAQRPIHQKYTISCVLG